MSVEDSMLSDEDRDALIFKYEQIKLALAQLNLELSDSEDEEADASKGKFWKFMFGLDEDSELEDKIAAIGQLAINTFSDINRIISNAENKQLQDFEKANNKKKQALEYRLNSGKISQDLYNATIADLDEKLDKKKRKLEHDQAKRAKSLAIMGAIVNTAVAVTGALGTMPPPLGIALAIIVGALGAIQIAAIATEPLPALAAGNRQKILADDGKTYNARVAPKNRNAQIFSEPTFIPGLGLVGETNQPELVFNPAETQALLNSPALIDAINMTLGSTPQYAQGNSREIIRENNTVTTSTMDDETKALLADIRNKLAEPSQAILVADENYIRTHKKKVTEYDTFKSRVSG